MEENKNNAIEKVENIENKPETNSLNKKSRKTSSNKKGKNVKKSTNKKNNQNRQEQAEERNKKRKEKERIKLQKAKEKKEKKEKDKNARLLKKQAKQKAKLDRQQAKEARKERIKALKLKKKEERKQRKEILKHETKKDKNARLATKRREKNEIKRQKIADRKAKRSEKIEQKRQKRQNRSQQRRERRNKNHGFGGWLAAVISLGCTVLVLGGLLTLTFFTPIDDFMNTTTAEERSFYDLVGYTNELDVNLQKLIVSNDNEHKQKILNDIRVQSSLATSSISMLALHDEEKFYTTKFINQVGDFAKYLENKLIDGKEITNEDLKTLQTMSEINSSLKYELSSLASSLGEDFDFRSLYEGKKDNLVISKFTELESNAVDYPHMIYDGAFSDTVKAKGKAKFIEKSKEYTKKEAEDMLKKYFKGYAIQEITLTGEAITDAISCYDFELKIDDGSMVEAQITKNGGKLIMFNHYKDCTNSVIGEKEASRVATEFLENAGYKNMKAVWKTEGNNLVSYNFASVVDGVICYSDLIKINVCQERGVVSGFEASSYILNHVEREPKKAKISLENARAKVSDLLEVKTSRLAIIPIGQGETLAYEFTALRNGETYYVYIDAVSGKEVEIFKVVRTTEGTLIL